MLLISYFSVLLVLKALTEPWRVRDVDEPFLFPIEAIVCDYFNFYVCYTATLGFTWAGWSRVLPPPPGWAVFVVDLRDIIVDLTCVEYLSGDFGDFLFLVWLLPCRGFWRSC